MHQWEVGCAATCLSVCSARPPRNKTFVYVKCSGKKHQDKLVFCEGTNNGRAGWFSQRHLTQRHNTHPQPSPPTRPLSRGESCSPGSVGLCLPPTPAPQRNKDGPGRSCWFITKPGCFRENILHRDKPAFKGILRGKDFILIDTLRFT